MSDKELREDLEHKHCIVCGKRIDKEKDFCEECIEWSGTSKR